MSPKSKIVFLYSEIAGYFIACAEALAKHSDVLIVRWPVNKEAPFNFELSDRIKIVEKSDYTKDALLVMIHDFEPTKIVCSGWMDKDYLAIVRSFRKKIPAVLTLDNHWTGGIKQRLAALVSPFMFKTKFTHAWVPGKPQTKFAQKLGFKKIETGFYCADVDLHAQNFDEKNVKLVQQFLFVGRYVKQKSIFEMWQAFIELIEEQNITDWEMICVGTGEEWDNRIAHEKIKHVGFVQPKELKNFVKEKPVYILPSSFEPWGVSVQEFAIAGCPLIISDKVGASEMFLEEGRNGVLTSPDLASIKKAMKRMINTSKIELQVMSKASNKIGMKYTPEDWVKKILSIKL